MKTLSAIYKGNGILELSENLEIPQDTPVTIIIPNSDDEPELRLHIQDIGQKALEKLWENQEDEVWNEYV